MAKTLRVVGRLMVFLPLKVVGALLDLLTEGNILSVFDNDFVGC